jgi:hypothetical protein
LSRSGYYEWGDWMDCAQGRLWVLFVGPLFLALGLNEKGLLLLFCDFMGVERGYLCIPQSHSFTTRFCLSRFL